MYINKNQAKNIILVLVIISTLTLLIPFSSISNTVYAVENKNKYNNADMSEDYGTDDGSYYEEDGKQYYNHYPLKDKTNNLNVQIEKCEECFLSEITRLENKIASKIFYEIDKEFGDLSNLCRLIANERIDREQLEQILINILSNLDYSYDYPNEEQYYNNDNDNNNYYYNYDSNTEYVDTYSYYNNNNEYNGYDYGSHYDYKLDENVKRQIIQNILNCLFEQLPELLVVWTDNTFGNVDIFLAKSIDGGETFSTPENISNNNGSSLVPTIAIQGNSVYVAWQDFTSGNFDIFIAKSTDGGETFSTPENISNNNGSSVVPTVAIQGNSVYVTWQDGTATPGSREIFLAKSTDGGETFSTPENISNNKGLSLFAQIAVNGNNVYVVWSDDTNGFDEIFLAKSIDGGETFGTPENISDENISNNASFSYQPSIIVNGNNVYVVWHEDPLRKRSIFVAKSTDGGETFSTPENISNNHGFSNIASDVIGVAFEPSVVVNGNTVYVAWTDGTPGNWEILLAKSTDGGKTFGIPENISSNEGPSEEPELALLQ